MAEERTYFVYLLASRPYGTLYIGVTNNLYRRMIEHREGRVAGFTKKYRVTQLVYFETFAYIEDAIQREKSLKEWPRLWKINLIERSNPHWQDLFPAMQRFDPLRRSEQVGQWIPGPRPGTTQGNKAPALPRPSHGVSRRQGKHRPSSALRVIPGLVLGTHGAAYAGP